MSKKLIVIFAGYHGFAFPLTAANLELLQDAIPVDLNFITGQTQAAVSHRNLEISIIPASRLQQTTVAPPPVSSAPPLPEAGGWAPNDDDIPF